MNIVCPILMSLLTLGGTAAERTDFEPPGTLMICGGGRLPASVISAFVSRAGGDEGHLVVIPTASTRTSPAELDSLKQLWHDRGIPRVSILHTTDRRVADTDAFISVLDEATAVWIGGGQQSKLAAAYQGTATETRLRRFFTSGGVVGGTSAGAAIMSQVMIASGNPTPQLSEGFDLLPGAIIDQHFLKRNRCNRLLAAVNRHPQRTGVGIDEGTAVEYRAGRCRVVGDSYVVLVNASSVDQSVSISTWHNGETFPLMPTASQ